MADNLERASESGGKTQASTKVLALSSQARQDLVSKKATCPFLGTAIATELLPVRNSVTQPLASIDDVVRLGNVGGGDLGDVLQIFAQGNHAFMPGASGKLDQPVRVGHFSLDLPGSQGSHPGHSGILQGHPNVLGSGRFSQEDFDRLTSRAKDSQLKRSDIGKFIAENLRRDPEAKIFSTGQFLSTFWGVLGQTVPALVERITSKLEGTLEATEERELIEKLTTGARSSNLVGSAGEFGLLLAFLEHKPGARIIEGEPAVSVEDLTLMFKEKKFPIGWEMWPKTRAGWLENTIALVRSAHKELAP